MNWLNETFSHHWMFLFLGPIYIGLEAFNPIKKDQKLFRGELGQDVFWYLLNNVYIDSLLFYVRVYITLNIAPHIWGWLISLVGPLSTEEFSSLFPLKIESILLLAFIIFVSRDFLSYWAHYLSHRLKVLWSFHILHHSVRELDWLSGFRSYWLDGIIFDLIISLPLVFFEVSEEGLAIIALWETHLQFFIHTNYKYSLGRVGKWLNNNKVHWWHHSSINYHRFGQNFGSYTLVWDKLFGTYYAEAEVPDSLGLNDPTSYPSNVVKRFFYPFLRFITLFKK